MSQISDIKCIIWSWTFLWQWPSDMVWCCVGHQKQNHNSQNPCQVLFCFLWKMMENFGVSVTTGMEDLFAFVTHLFTQTILAKWVLFGVTFNWSRGFIRTNWGSVLMIVEEFLFELPMTWDMNCKDCKFGLGGA